MLKCLYFFIEINYQLTLLLNHIRVNWIDFQLHLSYFHL